MNSIIEAPETYLGPIGKALIGIVILIIGGHHCKINLQPGREAFQPVSDFSGGLTPRVEPRI